MMANPNVFAYFALAAWPVAVLWLYSTKKVTTATIWAILGGYLLLPVGASVKIEMIPQFDKGSLPSLAAFVASMIILRGRIKFWSGFGLVEVLLVALLVCPFITSMLNTDPIEVGRIVLPGVGAYDAGSAIIAQFIVLIPFFLGRHILRNEGDTQDILRALVVAGLVYSLPMLFEVRMSPQLHVWIYGYFPHMFAQQMRDDGFRPVVFLGHGLLVAHFAMTSVVAAAAFWRARARFVGVPSGIITVYLGGVLVLCKTLGALLYACLLLPLVRWTSPRTQSRIAMFLVLIALLYPMLRTIDLVPVNLFVDVAEIVSKERAGSLQVRFDQESRLLERASERFWFGWGRFGRSRIYDQWGGDATLSDGYWIITFGQFGFVGFAAEFGLLALAVLRAASAFKFAESKQDRLFFAALTLIVAISIFDLLPNASIRPWTWLLVGALLGRSEALRAAGAILARQKSNRVPVRA